MNSRLCYAGRLSSGTDPHDLAYASAESGCEPTSGAALNVSRQTMSTVCHKAYHLRRQVARDANLAVAHATSRALA